MSKLPDLTIYVAVRDGQEYIELFLKSLAEYGASQRYHITMSILVGDAPNNILQICRKLSPNLPFDCRVRSLDDLSIVAQSEIRALIDTNDGFFNEGIWDWLVKENLERSTYYAGVHVDVAFHKSGLWDELLTNVITARADVAGIFSPGELLNFQGINFLTPPRLVPILSLCHRKRANALGVKWGRPCATISRRDRLILDNGTLALESLMSKQAATKKAIFLPLTMDYLENFIEHFGFLWTLRASSAIHDLDGVRSRERVRDALNTFVGKKDF